MLLNIHSAQDSPPAETYPAPNVKRNPHGMYGFSTVPLSGKGSYLLKDLKSLLSPSKLSSNMERIICVCVCVYTPHRFVM